MNLDRGAGGKPVTVSENHFRRLKWALGGEPGERGCRRKDGPEFDRSSRKYQLGKTGGPTRPASYRKKRRFYKGEAVFTRGATKKKPKKRGSSKDKDDLGLTGKSNILGFLQTEPMERKGGGVGGGGGGGVIKVLVIKLVHRKDSPTALSPRGG